MCEKDNAKEEKEKEREKERESGVLICIFIIIIITIIIIIITTVKISNVYIVVRDNISNKQRRSKQKRSSRLLFLF